MGTAHRKLSKELQRERDEKVVRLYHSGLQQNIVAQRMGMSETSVQRAVKRLGGEIQRPIDPFAHV